MLFGGHEHDKKTVVKEYDTKACMNIADTETKSTHDCRLKETAFKIYISKYIFSNCKAPQICQQTGQKKQILLK